MAGAVGGLNVAASSLLLERASGGGRCSYYRQTPVLEYDRRNSIGMGKKHHIHSFKTKNCNNATEYCRTLEAD